MSEKYLSKYTGEQVDDSVALVTQLREELNSEISEREQSDQEIKNQIPTKVSELINDSEYINSIIALQPSVTTLASNSSATANISITTLNGQAKLQLSLGIPRGLEGENALFCDAILNTSAEPVVNQTYLINFNKFFRGNSSTVPSVNEYFLAGINYTTESKSYFGNFMVSSLTSDSAYAKLQNFIEITGTIGPPGEKGDTGDPGQAATITIGQVTTLGPEASATVTNTGTSTDSIINFGIPRGAQGEQGPSGAYIVSATITEV